MTPAEQQKHTGALQRRCTSGGLSAAWPGVQGQTSWLANAARLSHRRRHTCTNSTGVARQVAQQAEHAQSCTAHQSCTRTGTPRLQSGAPAQCTQCRPCGPAPLLPHPQAHKAVAPGACAQAEATCLQPHSIRFHCKQGRMGRRAHVSGDGVLRGKTPISLPPGARSSPAWLTRRSPGRCRRRPRHPQRGPPAAAP